MPNEEFTRAFSYANSALGLLKRGEVPPYPQFYELFYTYATGVNPDLNKRINAILSEGTPQLEVVESLYNEFLKADAIDERINSVSDLMSKNIGSVHDAIKCANETASSYSSSLQHANAVLSKHLDPEALQQLTQQLLQKTQVMQKTNNRLEIKLESAQDDILFLKQDLEEVQRQSMTDSLTKIYNRKFFDLHISKSIIDAHENKKPLCLVMLDIDHFKNFNDTYGHQTGDQVLRLVASILRSNTKGSDMACRYGGEEFAIILPETDLKGATLISNKIRKAIQAKELLKRSTNEKLGRITASFGIALLNPSDTETSLVERSDNALYAAKNNGRNKVVTENDKTMHTSSHAA